MMFLFRYWDSFCKELADNGIKSIPAREVNADVRSYLVLKHDVETNVPNAYKIAQIENKYGHRGSYYVQAYLLENENNVRLSRQYLPLTHGGICFS